MDKVFIKDLAVRAIIGVNPWEREKEQEILINVILYGDISKSVSSDTLDEGINYRSIAKKLIAYTEKAKKFTVEALANDLARLCLEEERVEKVTMRVEKPGAVRFSRSVGVEIERRKTERLHTVCLLLGSNIEGEKNLPKALQLLKGSLTLIESSSVWLSEAVGSQGPDFLNAAVVGTTMFTREELKANLLSPIEAQLGRVREEDKNAPRTIDIDLIVYDGEVVDPTLYLYPHIALPVAEILPENAKIREAAMVLSHDSSVHKKVEFSHYPFSTKFNLPSYQEV
ncbi:MAG: 2-amino-4-hydroxy-6-hydroxymethyldihydropteridine diphosphokinase [Sphaerochaetaceae bacterium]